jgi:hypothetical protein
LWLEIGRQRHGLGHLTPVLGRLDSFKTNQDQDLHFTINTFITYRRISITHTYLLVTSTSAHTHIYAHIYTTTVWVFLLVILSFQFWILLVTGYTKTWRREGPCYIFSFGFVCFMKPLDTLFSFTHTIQNSPIHARAHIHTQTEHTRTSKIFYGDYLKPRFFSLRSWFVGLSGWVFDIFCSCDA